MAKIDPVEANAGSRAPAQRSMATALLVLGAALIVASFALGGRSSQNAWTPEKAHEYQATSARLHSLSHKYAQDVSEGNTRRMRSELDEVKAEYDGLRAELEDAIQGPLRLTRVLRYLGILFMAAAGVLFYRTASHAQR